MSDKWKIVLVAPVVFVACSSNPEPVESEPSPSPSPEVMTAADYWDQYPARVHDLCTPIQFFANAMGTFDETAYRLWFKQFRNKNYDPGPTDPSAEDAFAELIVRCDLEERF